jgi:hypothetical protein
VRAIAAHKDQLLERLLRGIDAVLHGDAAGRRRPLLDDTPYYLSSAIGWPWLIDSGCRGEAEC